MGSLRTITKEVQKTMSIDQIHMVENMKQNTASTPSKILKVKNLDITSQS